MIIKKFQGKTKEEALECAKKELGEGIVEMNVKTVKAKGLLGIFKGTKIEVTVAKEEENEKYGMASARESQKDGVAVSLSQSAVSHQLRFLKQMHLIKFRREGKNILYSLDDDHVLTILEMGLEHVVCE